MDLNDVRSLVTLLGLALFVGLMVWTWWPARRTAHEAAAQLPFDGEARDFDDAAAREPERRAAGRQRRQAFGPSKSAQADSEPRPSAPSRARSPRGIGRGTPRTRG